MGAGDNLMASGMAKGAAARGKRIAFGDSHKIIWDHNSELIFGKRSTPTENKNVARPGDEDGDNLEWIPFYKGNRIYNRHVGDRWVWNYDFRPTPGEIFFAKDEERFGERFGKGFILIEPNVPQFKSVAPNKQWSLKRYELVANELRTRGYDVRQLTYGSHPLSAARPIKTANFRVAMSVMKHAALYIGAEGGLHHAAAALGIPAVVLFGGFIPPQVTGYDFHTNLTGGAEACGSLKPCAHCARAMKKISCEEVVHAATTKLKAAA